MSSGSNRPADVPVPRHKVPIKPGKTLSAWMIDKQQLPRFPLEYFTLDHVALHNSPTDFWCVLFGKVYDITPYLDYHPGGFDILLPYAGKDVSSVFSDYHAWVNYENLLDSCLRGFLAY